MTLAYLICRGTSGAHESSSVFSVWLDPDLAIREAARLATRYPSTDDRDIDVIEIATVEIGRATDDPNVTWAPVGWRAFQRSLSRVE
jgi:hypothetical protein